MITVHLSQAGTQVFRGTFEQARAAAEEWIQSQQRRAKDDEKQDEELPPGVNARSWAAYCSPCSNRVFQALSDAVKPLTTMQVAELEGQGLIEITKNSEWKLSPRFVSPECQRLPLHLWQPIRLQVFLRDGFVCTYCGAKGVSLECDHVVPISKGGTNDLSNLTTACVKCNRDKRDKTPEEWLGRSHG